MFSFLKPWSKPEKCQTTAGDSREKDFKCLSYSSGKLHGHGNGSINLGTVAPSGTSSDHLKCGDADKMAAAVKVLAEAVNLLDDNSNGSAGGGKAPAEGRGKITSLTHVGAEVEGLGNGAVNFGNVLYESVPGKKGEPLKENSHNTKL